MMEYLIRFAQMHETFRLPEVQALAALEGIDLEVVRYSLEVGSPEPVPWNKVLDQVLILSSSRPFASSVFPPKTTLGA